MIIEVVFSKDGNLDMQIIAPRVSNAAIADEPGPESPAFIL